MIRKRYLLFLLLAFFFVSGCCQKPCKVADKDTVVKINSYTITRDEFEQEFKDSAYGKIDSLESRQNFLTTLIDRKLILQYAQKEGLDKEKGFLRMIEKFWEQSLLKIALDQETKKIKESSFVTDDEVRRAYDNILKEGNISESYANAYKRIKWDLARSKETKIINDWIAGMRKKSHITVNNDILKEKK
ncbi:MAG: SurA N-terminal domain-containing protein [Candidatus Omnitrophica bacterium]|nr:SurA N-terminal domain-containing protein [Candidatus Omnitrophota bacterium]